MFEYYSLGNHFNFIKQDIQGRLLRFNARVRGEEEDHVAE